MNSVATLAAKVEAEVTRALRTTPDLSVGDAVTSFVDRLAPLSSPQQRTTLLRTVTANVSGFGVLDPYLEDPAVSELMIARGRMWIERAGALQALQVTVDDQAVLRVVERIIAPLGLQLNRAFPTVDARLPDGSRLHAVIPPVALDGVCVTIRRFSRRRIELPDFHPSPELLNRIETALAARRNVLVSGATGSGKTTLLNALASRCAQDDRVVTIEDAAELQLPGDHVVRLEARPAGTDGTGAVTVRDLVRNALRMRPDRLIVGEVRGVEALDMVAALNTGHDGSMTTIHANSATDALRRLELMLLLAGLELPIAALRQQIAAAIHLVVHVTRERDGVRRITEVGAVRVNGDGLEINA